MTTLYSLWHIYDNEHGVTSDTSIGTYTSEALAKQAIEELSDKPGFKKYPDGFRIIPCTLDHIEWPDGFPPYKQGPDGITRDNSKA